MLQGFLSFLGGLILHIGIAFGQVGMHAVHRHVDHLNLAVGGEDLLDVLLDNIPCESA